jgi:predicted NBD/HSP70 family sugar kinase
LRPEAVGSGLHLGIMSNEPSTSDKGARAHNRVRVMELLRQNGPLTLPDISQRTGLSRATVSSVVAELRLHHGVVNADQRMRIDPTPSIGRPPSVVGIDGSIGWVLGIDFGRGHVQIALADLSLVQMLGDKGNDIELNAGAFAVESTPDPSDQTALKATLDRTSTVVGEMLSQAHVDSSQVIGVGIGLPAPVNRREDRLYATTFIPGWQDFHPAHELRDRLKLPVVIDNEVNLCALAEMVGGAAKKCRTVDGEPTECTDVVYIKASTGLGCGLIINGQLYRGWIGTAGEIGHTVVDDSFNICYCGNRGCLHTVVGAATIADMLPPSHRARLAQLQSQWAQSEFSPSVQGKDDRALIEIIRWAREDDDPACRRALKEVGGRLGATVADVCNLLNPQRIVIGGVLSTAGDVVLNSLREAVESYTTTLSGTAVEVVAAQLPQGKAEVLGALIMALREPDQAFAQRLQRLVQDSPSRVGAAAAE